jgi:cytochrome c
MRRGAEFAQAAWTILVGISLAVLFSSSQAAKASETTPGDAARGSVAFEKVCSACHTIEKGARRRVGPNLFGIVGARIAQREGYPYSEGFRSADFIWDDDAIADFLEAPGRTVPGTKMDWSVRDSQQISDLIAFLKLHR